MLAPHRRDELIEWMKKMLQHSFVLDSLGDTAPDTMSHFEQLIEEHRMTTTLLIPQANKETLITPNPISRLNR